MNDMATTHAFLLDEGRNQHRHYVAQADAYRTISAARRPRRGDRKPLRLGERFGARLIELGRRICEHRGEVSVDVAYHRAQTHRSSAA